jgi:oligopeptide transport system substrate-binding protein
MSFVKNPDYYDADNVQIDRFEVDIITDQFTEVALYESGELDVAGDGPGTLPLEELARIKDDATLSQELNEGPRASTTYVGFTMTKPPFDDPLVRKAFSAAIDRETMVRDVVGSGVPATQFAPKGIFGAPDPEVGIATDVEQAQAWLAEAGYPDGEGFPTVTYRYFSSSLEEALGEALQAMWKEALNVDVKLEPASIPRRRWRKCPRCGVWAGALTIPMRTTGSTRCSTAPTAPTTRAPSAPRPTRPHSRLRWRPTRTNAKSSMSRWSH